MTPPVPSPPRSDPSPGPAGRRPPVTGRRSTRRSTTQVAVVAGAVAMAATPVVAAIALVGGATPVGATGTAAVGTVTEYDVGSSAGPPIVASDGTVWAGTFGGDLAEVTPARPVVLRAVGVPVPRVLEHPTGTIWFGLFAERAGRITPPGPVQTSVTSGLTASGSESTRSAVAAATWASSPPRTRARAR